MSFVALSDFASRYENTVPLADEGRVAVLIEDACAIAADIIGSTYDDGAEVPGAIVATVCAAVRRAYENPTGLQGETIGDYTWRTGGAGASVGIYFTPAEARVMRRAAGILGLKTLTLESYLPLPAADPTLAYLSEDGVVIVNMAEPEW
jgi:hypothetical protein